MAKDAGEQCPSFTPSGGETLDEVWYLFIYVFTLLLGLITVAAKWGISL